MPDDPINASVWLWGGLIVFIAISFVVDFKFFQRDHETPPSLKRATAWSVGWIVVALLFGVFLLLAESQKAGTEYLTGYLLERSLSLDNVFVFSLLFGAMAVPTREKQDVLELGIIFALFLRLIFILAGAAIIDAFDFVLYIFGFILLVTGIRMALQHGKQESIDPDKNPGKIILSKIMPVTDDYRGSSYFVKEGGKRMATPLLAVVAAVATADIIFAVDSIPAIFGITTDTFIVFSANAFALLGLRALFALLEGARERFAYLGLGLAFILVFIGVKMLIEDLYHIPIGLSLGVIIVALTASILISLRRTSGHGGAGPDGSPPTSPGRSVTPAGAAS